MNRLLILCALLCVSLSVCAQTASNFQGITSVQASGNLLKVIPLAPVVVCGWPTVGSNPCTNLSSTFVDPAESSPCPSTAQVISPGTSTCSGFSDAAGNFTFFAASGNFAYFFKYLGIWRGPFIIVLGGSGGGGSGNFGTIGGGTNTGQSLIVGNGSTMIATGTGSITATTSGRWAVARNLAGNAVDGSANVAFTNKFIVQGTSDAGLSGAQFLGALSTGILKVTTGTGVITNGVGADVIALFSGTCNTTTFVRGDATCQTVNAFTAGTDLSGSSTNQTVIGLKAVPFCAGYAPTAGQVPQYTTGGSPNPCYGSVTITGGGNVSNTGTPLVNQVSEFTNATTIKGTSNFTDTGTSLNYGGQVNPASFGNGPNNECEVDGIAHASTQACGDAAHAAGLTSVLIRTNLMEDITTDPFSVSMSPEWYIGTGLNGTVCDSTNVNCMVLEVPIILGTGATIRGTGNIPVSLTQNMSQGTIIVTGNSWPPPLGVPTEAAPTCSASGTGTLSNGTYFVYVRTANNLETHSGKSAVAGPSMHSAELSVTCSGGTSTQTISVPIPSAVGNSPFQAQDFQVAAATVSGQEQIQVNDTTNMACTAGVVSVFNAKNYGCKMSGGTAATIKTIQTATRFFEDTDLSNVPIVQLPNQTVGFGTSISGLRLNCGPIASASGFNAPNWMIWNQAGEELNGLSPFGLGVTGPCAGYSAGTPATGGSATAFGGGWIYQDTHSPNSTLENISISGGPSCGSSCPSTSPFTPIYLDGRADGTGIAAGTPRRISNITVNAKGSGAFISPAMIYATGLRSFVLIDTVHSEVSLIGQGDGNNGEAIQCDNGAYCLLNRVEAQVATTATVAHLTSTGTAMLGTGLCPIGTAGSTQDRCAGLGQTGAGATFKDDTTGRSYKGFIAQFASGSLNSIFGNLQALGTVDFTNSVILKARVAAGLTTSVNGDHGYDTTNKNWKFFQNGVDSYQFGGPVSSTYTNGDCAKFLVAAGVITLADNAAPCNSVASGTTNGIAYYTGTTAVGSTTPPTVNGSYLCGYQVVASVSVIPSCNFPGVPVDATNPAILLFSDRASFLNWTSGTALALPAVATNFAANYPFILKNTSTTLTITPNVGALDKIDGASTTTVLPNFAAFVYQDATSAPGHWFTVNFPTVGAFPICSDVTGNHLNFTAAGGITCGNTASGGPFNSITGGTNTSATMVLGTGSSLTFSGTGTVNANQINGATITPSIAVAGTNGSGQITVATAHELSTTRHCTDLSGSGTTQSCTVVPAYTVVNKDCIEYDTSTANTGALTLNVNSGGAIPVQKWLGQALVAGDIPAFKTVVICDDGTNHWQLMTIGNPPMTNSAESSLTGSTAATTITESGATSSITRAGVATANLTAPWVFQNTNSSNNNTSITLGVTSPGTSTGQTTLNVNGATTGGDLTDWGTGGTWTAGVLSGQTKVASVNIQGAFVSGGTTAGYYDYAQGTTSVAQTGCATATSICEQAPTAVTSYLVNKPGVAAPGTLIGTNSAAVITQGFSGDTNHSATVTTGSGTSIGSTSICSTTFCPAGTYRVNVYIDITTACGTTGSYTVNLIYTDDQGSKTVPVNLEGTGSVPATGVLTTTSTANFGYDSFVLRSTGSASINYSTTAVACGTAGPMVGKLYFAVEPLM